MKKFGKFLKKLDAFGHAVTINYRGDEMYKTVWGAMLTLMQKSFILVVTIIGVFDLFNYREPKITQYTIFDKRNDGKEINFGENYGSFVFGLHDLFDKFQPIDARYGYFELVLAEYTGEIKRETKLSIDEYT